MKVIVDQIESLNASIKKLDEELIDKGKDLDGHENITSIKGIGDKNRSILSFHDFCSITQNIWKLLVINLLISN